MKKNIFKYFLLISGLLALIIIYLSIIGFETEKFNNQIQDKVFQTNKNLKIELKTIKLTLDPLKFKINAKTIGPKILYKTKNLELEYIKTQISLISVLKNRFVSSKLELSTKAILLKDLVTFIRATTNKPELFILEKVVKKGQVITDVELNFDENGNLKKDYKIKIILKNGRIELFKNYNFEKINFFLNVKNNNFNFKNINFTTNKIKFFLDNLIITQNKNNFLLKGEIQNKNSILSDELQKLINSNFKNLNLSNTSFSSKNKFSFNVNNKFKMNNLDITSEIKINKSDYLKPILFNDYFPDLNNFINIKNHKIKLKYKKNDLTLKGYGKVKLEKDYNNIEYTITNKKNIFNVNSKVELSELKLKNQKFLKPFFPKLKEITNLKDQLIEINYNKDNLSIKGLGKIKLEKEFEDIDFFISKIKDKFSFDTKINLEKTSFNINFLNFKKDDKLKTQLMIVGNFNDQNELNFNEIIIKDKNNKIVLENLLLDKDNLIIKVDKIDLDYFDKENKKNKFSLLRKQKNNYKINGSLFNANKLIDNLLKSKSNDDSKILKSDISLSLELNKVYIDEKDTVKNLRGKLNIKDNKIIKADISALFDKNGNLTFTINSNDNGEKITTFNSSKAKPIVKKYDFIKGFEGGNLDFSSTKKDNISNSVLIIDDFKVQEVPVLAKLLSLASLQGIADLLTGEGIRFTNFEMIFSNNKDLMTIEELYAIGPSISLLIDGYIQNNKLISLRGTLVPATTINKNIASIPLIGDLLIGKKAGEGVFGVSFKIKGPPKDLKTTVNPIKTLTPRFITRTLEKIKKN
jgi:hypothetical protein